MESEQFEYGVMNKNITQNSRNVSQVTISELLVIKERVKYIQFLRFFWVRCELVLLKSIIEKSSDGNHWEPYDELELIMFMRPRIMEKCHDVTQHTLLLRMQMGRHVTWY